MEIKKLAGFTRNNLAKHFGKKGYKEGAEIGVQAGLYSEKLCQKNPQLKLHCVDSWDVKEYRAGKVGAPKQERFYQQTIERLKPFNCNIIKKSSIEASLDFADDSLDFVYIDAGHQFDYVMEDIIAWGRKVKKGGVISGHDYFNFVNSGVIEAVNIYCKAHGVKCLYLSDEKYPTWWFKKIWD